MIVCLKEIRIPDLLMKIRDCVFKGIKILWYRLLKQTKGKQNRIKRGRGRGRVKSYVCMKMRKRKGKGWKERKL